ncbi:MAG: hypothetical protein N2C14_16315, partial [Planctomycetales bacterium]
GSTIINIQGADLLPDPQLILGAPIAKQVVLENAAANNLRMKITLGADVEPGLYNLRLANANGISESVVVAVDRLPQSPVVPADVAQEIESLPVALHGTITGARVEKFAFTGKKGQQFVAEVESQRLGAKLRPVIHLYDSRRRQLAWTMSSPTLLGDARLTTSLPADGRYSLELHDLQYAGGAPGHYRLKIGSFQYADMVYPPAVSRGSTVLLEFIGNLPAGSTKFTASGSGEVLVPWPKADLASGLRPKVLVSDLPELMEDVAATEPQAVPSPPFAVSGRLDALGQEDAYRIPVTEGAKLRLEVFSDRLGAGTDLQLEVCDETGRRLAFNDDAAGTTDPRLDYTVAKGLSVVEARVRNILEQGDPRRVYRLAVTSLDEPAKREGFRLHMDAATHNVPEGGRRVVKVSAERNGYDGPIRLAFDRLPPGVTAANTEIPPGANGALMTLTGAKHG